MTIPKDESLMEIGVFLARRWSGHPNTILAFSSSGETLTRGSRMTLPSLSRLSGGDFERYRQFRAILWYESMRLRFCTKILSNDHAFGFILNALETLRAEALGRREWAGMDAELAFNYTYQWEYRPDLESVRGRARIAEGFYQLLLFGRTKGTIDEGRRRRMDEAADLGRALVEKALEEKHDTAWLKVQVPRILRILELDSLLTMPAILPWMRPDSAIPKEKLYGRISRTIQDRPDLASIDLREAQSGAALRAQFRATAGPVAAPEPVGMRIPSRLDIDESVISDPDLLGRLKSRFKDWKSGWRESLSLNGDEFDAEAYVDGHAPFIRDAKRTIKKELVILLDHSSSIASEQIQYKKATLALCEVLSYLGVVFSVYAFSTLRREVVCWAIKPPEQKWNSLCAKRLAQISANGATPLTEVYELISDTIRSRKPGIFLTLTDGEPADPVAAASAIRSFRAMGTSMVALGLGSDTMRATAIASNLGRLGYERTLAVGRLYEIPDKVLGILGGGGA